MDEEEADPALSGGSGVEEIVLEEDPFDPRNFVVINSENIRLEGLIWRLSLLPQPLPLPSQLPLKPSSSFQKSQKPGGYLRRIASIKWCLRFLDSFFVWPLIG